MVVDFDSEYVDNVYVNGTGDGDAGTSDGNGYSLAYPGNGGVFYDDIQSSNGCCEKYVQW